MPLIRRIPGPRSGKPFVIPRGFGVVDVFDYENVAIIAPLGLHLVIRAARAALWWVEYRAPAALEESLPKRIRLRQVPIELPFSRYVAGDDVADVPGQGYCWEECFGRYTAPIGLNLVYAAGRWCWLKWRYRKAWY